MPLSMASAMQCLFRSDSELSQSVAESAVGSVSSALFVGSVTSAVSVGNAVFASGKLGPYANTTIPVQHSSGWWVTLQAA